ncbi:uncharacterized protein ARMOST_00252 [Armillaria ostoyae]|uniref:Uncharacterized protein n=1 Tax=Armillaria ostoyae TaxID=47428 RepID=A0A284QKN8_ARMOS|nr:uncharacterized protein ARMOST_00252 [Armillaria ostoyae]
MENIAFFRLAEKWDSVGILLVPSHELNGNNRVLLTNDRQRIHRPQCTSHRLVPSVEIQASPVTNAHEPSASPASPLCSRRRLRVLATHIFGLGRTSYTQH